MGDNYTVAVGGVVEKNASPIAGSPFATAVEAIRGALAASFAGNPTGGDVITMLAGTHDKAAFDSTGEWPYAVKGPWLGGDGAWGKIFFLPDALMSAMILVGHPVTIQGAGVDATILDNGSKWGGGFLVHNGLAPGDVLFKDFRIKDGKLGGGIMGFASFTADPIKLEATSNGIVSLIGQSLINEITGVGNDFGAVMASSAGTEISNCVLSDQVPFSSPDGDAPAIVSWGSGFPFSSRGGWGLGMMDSVLEAAMGPADDLSVHHNILDNSGVGYIPGAAMFWQAGVAGIPSRRCQLWKNTIKDWTSDFGMWVASVNLNGSGAHDLRDYRIFENTLQGQGLFFGMLLSGGFGWNPNESHIIGPGSVIANNIFDDLYNVATSGPALQIRQSPSNPFAPITGVHVGGNQFGNSGYPVHGGDAFKACVYLAALEAQNTVHQGGNFPNGQGGPKYHVLDDGVNNFVAGLPNAGKADKPKLGSAVSLEAKILANDVATAAARQAFIEAAAGV